MCIRDRSQHSPQVDHRPALGGQSLYESHEVIRGDNRPRQGLETGELDRPARSAGDHVGCHGVVQDGAKGPVLAAHGAGCPAGGHPPIDEPLHVGRGNRSDGAPSRAGVKGRRMTDSSRAQAPSRFAGFESSRVWVSAPLNITADLGDHGHWAGMRTTCSAGPQTHAGLRTTSRQEQAEINATN